MLQPQTYPYPFQTSVSPTSYVTSAPIPSINSAYSPTYQQYASGYPAYQSPIYQDHNQYRIAPNASHQYPLYPSNQPISHPAYVTSGHPYHTSAYAGYPYIQGFQQPKPSERRKSYIPYTRKYIDYENQVIRVPVQRVRMGYYDQITEIQYVPRPVETIVMETVPVQRETQKVVYIPVQRKIIHLPEHQKGRNTSQFSTMITKNEQKNTIINPTPSIDHRINSEQNKNQQAFQINNITFGQSLNKNFFSNQQNQLSIPKSDQNSRDVSVINLISQNKKASENAFEVKRSSFEHGQVQTSGNFKQSRVKEVPSLRDASFKYQNLNANQVNIQKYE